VSARAEIDWAGGALLAAILGGVTWLLGTLSGQASAGAIAMGIVATALLTALFVRRELTARSGVAGWGLFRRRSFAAATTYVMVSNLVMYTSLLTIPFFVSEVQGKGSAPIGALLGVMSVLMAAAAPVSGFVSDLLGRRPLALAGSIFVLAGAVLMVAGIADDVSFAYLATALALLGLGIGLGTGAATTAALESAPRSLAGGAAGTTSMMRYVGSIVGAGILAGVLGSEAIPGAEVFQSIYVVVTAMAIVAVIASTAIHGRMSGQPAG
jgi:MFS family permease